jgi:hypothetical protein
MSEGQEFRIDVPPFNLPVIITLVTLSWIPILSVALLVLT